MFFAGIWRDWERTRGTKANPVTGNHLVYLFLASEASADVAETHSDANPVLLLNEEERNAWLNAPWEIARDLQRTPGWGCASSLSTRRGMKVSGLFKEYQERRHNTHAMMLAA